MFTLDHLKDDNEIDLLCDQLMVEYGINANREPLHSLLQAIFLDCEKTEPELMVNIYIIMHVARKTNWQNFLTVDNLNTFINDSVLIMCSESQFLTDQPWMICQKTNEPHDMLSNVLGFLAEQFISIFEP